MQNAPYILATVWGRHVRAPAGEGCATADEMNQNEMSKGTHNFLRVPQSKVWCPGSQEIPAPPL